MMKHDLLKVTSEAEAEVYRRQGHWGDRSIVQRVRDAAARDPAKIAIVDGDRNWSYDALMKAVDNLAGNLRAIGIEHGDVVGVQLPNCVEIPLCHLALNRIGAIILPLHDSYREHELEHLLERGRATAIITESSYRGFDHLQMAISLQRKNPNLRLVIGIRGQADGVISFDDLLRPSPFSSDELDGFMADADDIGLLMLSSGTTSLPKISIYTSNNILCLMDRFARCIALSSDDVAAALAPMGTGATGYVFPILPPLIYGATAVILKRWDGPASAIDLILRHGCTYATAIPTQKTLLIQDLHMHDPSEFAQFRFFNNAGAPLPTAVARELEALMQCKVTSCYGASDGGIPAMGAITDSVEQRTTTVGHILDGTLLELRTPEGALAAPGEVGEICWKAPDKSYGYLNDIEAARTVFDDRGFYKSGDLGELDTDGYLRVVGRVKDMILRGGRNISPRLIEEILIAHPDIVDVAVAPMPHEQLGEQACAFVVVADGKNVTFDQAVAFLKERQIVIWQLPERLELLDQIPRNSGGKVDKKALTKYISDKLEKEHRAAVR
jgi:non-ribosomal peptide synthetase component E (peptide arylation enzyme)